MTKKVGEVEKEKQLCVIRRVARNRKKMSTLLIFVCYTKRASKTLVTCFLYCTQISAVKTHIVTADYSSGHAMLSVWTEHINGKSGAKINAGSEAASPGPGMKVLCFSAEGEAG